MHETENADNLDFETQHDNIAEYIDDPLDEKTFQLELQVVDPERRELASYIDGQLYLLAMMRAENQNVSVDDAYEHLFDPTYLRADMHGSNRALALLAEHVWEALDELSDLRCSRRYESPMLNASPANTNTITNGVRRAV